MYQFLKRDCTKKRNIAKGKKHTPEQIVSLLRQIEVAVANGKTTLVACLESGITEQTYYRWLKEHGVLQVDQARRLKELEQENAKLKRLVSELLGEDGVIGSQSCAVGICAFHHH